MIRTYVWVAFLATLVSLTACGGGAGTESPETPAPQPPQRTIDEIVIGAANQGLDSIIVYIDDGSDITHYAAGHYDRESERPVNAEDLFKIASISKLYIAVAVAKLVTENVIGLDDSLSLWLPELSGRIANAEQATIRHLVEHRSGIPDFDSAPGFSWQNAHQDIEATLALVYDLPADFAADARYEYSNTNYLLLARVMDRVLGFSHRDYIQQAILDPLELQHTFNTYQPDFDEQLISGYWQGLNRKGQDYQIPGGSMVATASDVGRFIRALNDGSLLSAEERQHYIYWFEHSGWLPGYQSVAGYNVSNDTVVVQFVSTTGDDSEQIANDTYQDILDTL
ncbi:serine hydrolase domain-containing protein [Aestuariibacter salexigens]|uniref:serine hydrolase domain-containing protein n=1 Tax=Aestuariibacter salexigens TaxID=226010 RepID=UPI000686769D|nr:serine hydrolase domain-containing protein [Aestuariibacter salexigens]